MVGLVARGPSVRAAALSAATAGARHSTIANSLRAAPLLLATPQLCCLMRRWPTQLMRLLMYLNACAQRLRATDAASFATAVAAVAAVAAITTMVPTQCRMRKHVRQWLRQQLC